MPKSDDRRSLCATFRQRLRTLIGEERGAVSAFLRDTGVDRSALAQFLDPDIDRLPRAESLRRIAEARGVSVDWLLDLSNAPDGAQALTSTVQIEQARSEMGESPLDRWRQEAAGMKLRYVPSSLPDMPALAPDPQARDMRSGQSENVLGGFRLGDMDVEIAMPRQTLEDLAEGSGLWRDADAAVRRRQLVHMAETCEAAYPTLRLHLYDGRETFSAPFTVFGRIRAALFLGESYLVVTSSEQVAALSRHFDGLVRKAVVGPDRAGEALGGLADAVR